MYLFEKVKHSRIIERYICSRVRVCHVITYRDIEIKLEPSLSDGLLNTLAVGRVAGQAGASLALVHEAADLIRRTPGVLLAGAEAVHPASSLARMILVSLPGV